MKKLLVFDFDGTLYINNDERRMLNLLKELNALSEDYVISVASGRPYHLLKNYFSEFHRIYIISNDGALISKDDKIIYENPIDKNIIESLDENFEWAAYGESISYMHFKNRSSGIRWMEFFKYHGVYTSSVSDIKENIYKIMVNDRVFEIPGLKKCYDSYGVTEFVNSTADKGDAVLKLSEMLKIAKGDIISFGDGKNDISMFRVSGRSYAYKNSSPDVRKEAYGLFDRLDIDKIRERIV